MQRILIVEESSTLRHAVARQLDASGFEVRTTTTYADGLAYLRDRDEAFSAVLVGWPRSTDSVSDEFLVELEQPALRQLGMVVLSDRQEAAALNWARQRSGTALLLWEDYREIQAVLDGVWNELSETQAPDPQAAAPSWDIRILLVDDSPTSRFTYRKLLQSHGYVVETASSVAEGFDRAVAEPFDLAIIDYFMPEQTGDVLCTWLREDARTGDVTLSVLTGTHLDHVIADSLAAGAVECMFKNESDELFLARVAAMSRAVYSRRDVERDRRHLEGILNSVGDGVYGVDNAGRLSFMNPVARQILGFASDDDVVGRVPRTLFHHTDEDGRAQTAEKCFLTRAYANGERHSGWHTWFWTRDGRALPVEGTVYPLDIDGERQGSVIAFRDVTEWRQLEGQLRWQANHDALTKLLNRHYFEKELAHEVHRVARRGHTSALVCIDLDQFKYINDTAGHGAGDQLLLEVSQRLSTRLRGADTLARIGGDEFAIILHDIDAARVYEVADAYREILAQGRFGYCGKQYAVTASFGVAIIDRGIPAAGEAMAHADLAAHIAKQRGRNQTHLFEPADEHQKEMDRELGWSARLKQAVEHDEFELAFQPVVPVAVEAESADSDAASARWPQLHRELEDGNWHYEVLLRLRDESGNWILPSAFLPAAERFSLMPEIDRWTVNRALGYLRENDELGAPLPSLAINLSAESLSEPKLAGQLRAMIEEAGVDGRYLTFEVTETAAITRLDAAQRLIRELSGLGCRFALDDFGSGFCSFGHLKHLDVDHIKIDGLFVQGLISDPLDQEVILAINQIAHSMGKRTVAEFVETPEILKMVRACGVDFVQGNCIAPALASVPDFAAVAVT